MLINKGISPGEVVTIKVVTGEEIVAKYVEETSTGHKVSRPMVLSMTQKGLGMMPMLFTVDPDSDILINSASIVMITVTEADFAKQYTTSVTGIQLT
jgi:nitrous oxidase accessory protein NosD